MNKCHPDGNIVTFNHKILSHRLGMSTICISEKHLGGPLLSLKRKIQLFRPDKDKCVFLVFRPYLEFCLNPKHFIVKSEPKIVKCTKKWRKCGAVYKIAYRNVPKFSDTQVWAKVQTQIRLLEGAVLSGSTLFAIPSASFGCITLRKSHLVELLGWFMIFTV